MFYANYVFSNNKRQMLMRIYNCVSKKCFHIHTVNRKMLLYNNQFNCVNIRNINTYDSSFSAEKYCIDNVRKYDYENYLSSLLLSEPSVRRCAFAVRAFNIEISQIRDVTSTPLIAQMRLEFWTNAIDEIFSDESNISTLKQPIVYEIQKCHKIGGKKLSKHWFKKLIDSRTDRLSDFPFKTVNDLENYSETSVSPVFYLLTESMVTHSKAPLKANVQLELDHIGSHIGKAQGISNILRGVTHNAKYGRCYIPSEVLLKHKISHEDFLRHKQTQNVKDACYEIASVAHQHSDKAKSLINNVQKEFKLLFLPLITTQKYLSRLQKCEFNVFDSKLSLKQGTLPFSLWWSSKTLRF